MKSNMTVGELLATLPQCGTLQWIGLRPARRESLHEVAHAQLTCESGLVGDRYSGRSGTRQVTLIQHEHLATIASLIHADQVEPGLLRRNLAVSGINLLALKGKQFRIGSATLEYTGLCHPCSRMEEALGQGGYNAVRGHGGITARVLIGGKIELSDSITAVTE